MGDYKVKFRLNGDAFLDYMPSDKSDNGLFVYVGIGRFRGPEEKGEEWSCRLLKEHLEGWLQALEENME